MEEVHKTRLEGKEVAFSTALTNARETLSAGPSFNSTITN
jgi:hypothetical protein